MARLLLRLLLEIRMHRCSLLESLLIGFLLGFLIILLMSLLLVGYLLLGILVALVGFYCFQYSSQILYLPGRSPICHTLLPYQCFGTDALLYKLVETERTCLLSIAIDYKNSIFVLLIFKCEHSTLLVGCLPPSSLLSSLEGYTVLARVGDGKAAIALHLEGGSSIGILQHG